MVVRLGLLVCAPPLACLYWMSRLSVTLFLSPSVLYLFMISSLSLSLFLSLSWLRFAVLVYQCSCVCEVEIVGVCVRVCVMRARVL